MNDTELKELFAAADAGNKVAERLLLHDLLSRGAKEEIELLLAKKAQREGESNARYQRAELACFHGYGGDDSWENLLRRCCEEGHKEALFVAAVYHDWSGHNAAAELFTKQISGQATSAEGRDTQWLTGWSDWAKPAWQLVAEKDDVAIHRSGVFATPWLIGFLRSMLGPMLRPAAVIDPESGETVAHPVRINRVAQWVPEHLGWIGKLFECRLADAVGYPVEHGEVLSLLHYQPGQRYKPHVDCLGIKQATSEEGRREGGQRIATVLFGMGNDDVVGGDTHFPKLDVSVRPATGEIVQFNNTNAENEPLPASLHEGTAVESGEKWLLSKWVRESTTPYGQELHLAR